MQHEIVEAASHRFAVIITEDGAIELELGHGFTERDIDLTIASVEAISGLVQRKG